MKNIILLMIAAAAMTLTSCQKTGKVTYTIDKSEGSVPLRDIFYTGPNGEPVHIAQTNQYPWTISFNMEKGTEVFLYAVIENPLVDDKIEGIISFNDDIMESHIVGDTLNISAELR